MRLIKCLAIVFGFFCIATTPTIAANLTPIGMSTNMALSHPITSGDSNATMSFSVDEADALIVEVIAPIDGAVVYLMSPDGQVVTSSYDSQANIILGNTQTPSLPGGYMFLPEVKNPESGEWKIVVEFPNPDYNTVIIAQVAIQSPIAFGMAIAANEYVVGEFVPVAALLTNKGEPITGAQTYAVVIDEQGVETRIQLKDDGMNFDVVIGDGVYSNLFSPPVEGDYIIKGFTSFIKNGVTITRESRKKIHVLSADIEIISHSLTPLLSSEGCIIAIEQRLELDVKSEGDFAIHGYLTDSVNEMSVGKRIQQLKPAKQTVTLTYSKDDIVELFDLVSTLRAKPTIIYSITPDKIRLATARIQFEDVIDLALLKPCRKPSENAEVFIKH